MNHYLLQFQELFTQISQNPLHTIFIILSIVLIEVVLSFDNAAVLATMVKDLPKEQQNKALKYGIIGAFVFRGLALVFASLLIKIWWLKPIGGLYLIWMTYSYFKGKTTVTTDDDVLDKNSNWFYSITNKYIGIFWSTVALVELMDIVFSIDNIFAVVAFTNNIILICLGVFVGIIAMRFVAQGFVKLMEKYDFLETCAFIVIGILGIKLTSSVLVHFYSNLKWIESETTDIIVSGITLTVFILPILYKKITMKTIK
jgi:YkoY family integral membrane protein